MSFPAIKKKRPGIAVKSSSNATNRFKFALLWNVFSDIHSHANSSHLTLKMGTIIVQEKIGPSFFHVTLRHFEKPYEALLECYIFHYIKKGN